ncbi:MAG TPA: ribonuclease Z [Pyrinomonadaceae bacterium]|nr:ribonuclease Z [Pyrinomonadaceae bacterium]
MKLTVLGSGSTVPHPRRSSSAYWLETSGGNILLDCSATAAHRMAVCGVDWPNLDAIWISHFHMDHVGGMGPLLAGTKHAPEMQERKNPLTIYGPKGFEKLFNGISSVRDYKLREQPFPLNIVEVDDLEKFEIVPGVEAVTMSTPHTAESHAIHIRDGEASLMYSADTGFDEKIATFASGVDLMLLECAFVHHKPNKKHLTLPEAIHLIRKAKPTRAMLTHFYPEWDDVDFNKEVDLLSPMCEVTQAEDGMTFEITDNS